MSVTDSSGATININAYDEYGIPAPGNLGRFGYTGQTWLPELGMWYYKARIYSPTLGRFMQTDPIGYQDGMNWYNYVGSDPVNFADPLGLENEKPLPCPKEICVNAQRPRPTKGFNWADMIFTSFSIANLGNPIDEIVVTAWKKKKPQKNCGGLPSRGVLVEAKMIGANLPLSGGQFSGTATNTETGKSVDISATYFGAGLMVGASFDVSLTIYDFASFSKTGGEFRFAAASAGPLGNVGGKFNLVDLDGNVIGKGSAELLNVSEGNLTFPIAAAGFEILPPSCN